MTATDPTLDARFPGHRAKEPFASGPFRLRVLDSRCSSQRSECRGYGTVIGVDVSHTFGARLLLPPAGGGDGWAVFDLTGYSHYSERFDHESTTVRCELDDGAVVELLGSTHHEKFPSRNGEVRGDAARVLEHVRRRLGYADATAADLAALVSAIRRRFEP